MPPEKTLCPVPKSPNPAPEKVIDTPKKKTKIRDHLTISASLTFLLVFFRITKISYKQIDGISYFCPL